MGPAFKKRPGIVWDDYSVATIPVTAADGAKRALGDGQETLEERETRLRKVLADKMKASSEVAAGSGKKQVARLQRELFVVQVCARVFSPVAMLTENGLSSIYLGTA